SFHSSKFIKRISVTIKVEVNGELFDVNVLEISTWNTNITDTASDVSSQMEANHLGKDNTSVEDKENDDLDDIDGIMKDLDNDAKNEENVFFSKEVVPDQPIKQVEEDILKKPEEECIKVSESSDLSLPPGFENTKKTPSNNSKCSTNFARHHMKDIKGISLIHELNKIIEVGTTLGYDFDYACSMARGRSGGLISIWDPNFFSKEAIWCDDNIIIVKGHWNNEVGDCFMINIYGPQESAANSPLWNRLAEFMNQHNGKFILFDDFNTVLHEYESKKADFGHSPFKLYNSWLSRDGFEVDVRKNDRSQKSANLSEIYDIKKKIDDALDLIQKARIKWDIEGDENSKFFHGIINSKRRTQAIADDVIITTDWNPHDIDNIIRVLHVFHLASGLKINVHKSNIFDTRVTNDEISSMASRIGCAAGCFPLPNLGLSIGANMNLTSSWQILIDRF
nr:RNA-directed DNA polymerase, eukaryota [Tanacetum cinerariifolium]GEZ56543.1 RNA-directed DNA polymerase, eukaryota [Tanacetum cinerariifolium]